MSLLVDTSVWSLAFRRDAEASTPEVSTLRHALEGADQVFTTGLVLQELLQGFAGPKARSQLIERFGALGFLQPDREDHTEAAEVRNSCRRRPLSSNVSHHRTAPARNRCAVMPDCVDFGYWSYTHGNKPRP